MKIAKVIPIHKSSDPSLIKNYRPISLLPAFSKLIEKLMYKKITCFFNSNNIFYKHQYGFREKHSTIHPIIHLLNYCAESTSNDKSNYPNSFKINNIDITDKQQAAEGFNIFFLQNWTDH